MPVTITGYGGINEIGGSKLLVEDEERRFLFDFGMPFGRYGAFFDGVFTRERALRGLLDPIALGLLPPLRGLLRSDLIPCLDCTELLGGQSDGKKSEYSLSPQAEDAFWQRWQHRFPGVYRDLRRDCRPAVDAVLFSHAHQDHIADAIYLDPCIPAAGTCMTAFISKILADTGMAGQGATYCNSYSLDAAGALSVTPREPHLGRPWYFVDHDPGAEPADDMLESAAAFWGSSAASKGLRLQPCSLPASLTIRHWPVDHSLYGAAGYAVETSAGWVAYSGDLRMHGKHGQRTLDFAAALAKLQPAALLCEGTRLPAHERTSEAEVHDNCLAAARSAQGGMVVADFAPRNIERLETFIDIAQRTGRRLLLQPKDAYLLRAMFLADPSMTDWMLHPSAGLYADPKAKPRGWEEQVRRRYAGRTVDHRQVSQHPGDYILAFSLTDIADMVDIDTLAAGRRRGVYIFSNSAAYDDEQKVDLERLWTWVRWLGLEMVGLKEPQRNAGGALQVPQVDGYHASGHACQDDLVEFVQTVRPRRLIPVHCEEPELWLDLLRGSGIEVLLPEYGKGIDIRQ